MTGNLKFNDVLLKNTTTKLLEVRKLDDSDWADLRCSDLTVDSYLVSPYITGRLSGSVFRTKKANNAYQVFRGYTTSWHDNARLKNDYFEIMRGGNITLLSGKTVTSPTVDTNFLRTIAPSPFITVTDSLFFFGRDVFCDCLGGALRLPSTSPTVATAGAVRYDAATDTFEIYDGAAWQAH